MCGGGIPGLDIVKDVFSSPKNLLKDMATGGLGTQKKLAKAAVGQGKKDLIKHGILPEPVQPVDPAAERAAAEAAATQEANARIAMQRRAMRENSLFTGASSGGRSTLGVG